jgi:hypothetical protein
MSSADAPIAAARSGDVEAFHDELLRDVPVAGEERVQAEHRQCGDRGAGGTALASVVYHPPQRLTTVADTVDEDAGEREPGDADRVLLPRQDCDLVVELWQRRVGQPDRVRERPAADVQIGGRIGEALEVGVEVAPQLGATAEIADPEQRMQRLDMGGAGHATVLMVGEGRGQQPVRRVDVTIAVDQHESGRSGDLQRFVDIRVSKAGVGQESRSGAQVSGHVRANVRGAGESAAAIVRTRTQFGGAQKCSDRAHRVAAAQAAARRRVEDSSHRLVRLHGRRGQMPPVPVGLVTVELGELLVRPPTFSRGRQRHHR